MSKSTRIIHLVQFITVEPTLRCAYLLGPAAYRASHATLRAIDAMWAGTTPCHAAPYCDTTQGDLTDAYSAALKYHRHAMRGADVYAQSVAAKALNAARAALTAHNASKAGVSHV